MLKPTAFLLLCVMLVVGCAGVSEEPETAEPAQPVASAGATESDIPDERQRAAAVLPYDSDLIRNWSNLPAGILGFERNGVRIGDLDETQQAALHDFLATAMSPYGYATVAAVVAAEGVLEESSRARRLGWNADNYWLAFFGEPSATDAWRWQFGGHHLAINMSVRDGRVSMSPTFLGIEPARFSDAKGIRAPFMDRVDAGLVVINSLEGNIAVAALLDAHPNDLQSGTDPVGFVPFEGASLESFSAAQRQAVLDAAALWVNLMPEHSAQVRLEEIEAELEQAYFGWHGPADGTGSIYYSHPWGHGSHRVLHRGSTGGCRRPHPLDLPRSHQRIRCPITGRYSLPD